MDFDGVPLFLLHLEPLRVVGHELAERGLREGENAWLLIVGDDVHEGAAALVDVGLALNERHDGLIGDLSLLGTNDDARSLVTPSAALPHGARCGRGERGPAIST